MGTNRHRSWARAKAASPRRGSALDLRDLASQQTYWCRVWRLIQRLLPYLSLGLCFVLPLLHNSNRRLLGQGSNANLLYHCCLGCKHPRVDRRARGHFSRCERGVVARSSSLARDALHELLVLDVPFRERLLNGRRSRRWRGVRHAGYCGQRGDCFWRRRPPQHLGPSRSEAKSQGADTRRGRRCSPSHIS